MRFFAAMLGAMALVGCASDGYYSTNFDEWCGDLPCGWKVDAGSVKRAPTWHEHDYGAELVGQPAQISHYKDWISMVCLQVDLVASSERDAQLTLGFDFDQDGITDYEQPIPPSDFRAHRVLVRPPLGFSSVRYILRKTGPGRAVVGKLTAIDGLECYGERVMLGAGAACTEDASCSSGRCHDGRCSSCAIGTCQEGEFCSEDVDCADGACAGGVCRSCAKAGTCGARESCTSSAQCSSGACVRGAVPSLTRRPYRDGVCGECNVDSNCPTGRCVLGFCASCVEQSDCGPGLVCRYVDEYDATERACLQGVSIRRGRGALCESDVDCDPGLACGAEPGRAKRCGVSCGTTTQCDGGIASCAAPGARMDGRASTILVTPLFTNDVSARVATCHARPMGLLECTVDAHCPSLLQACCGGRCTDRGINRESGMCNAEPPR